MLKSTNLWFWCICLITPFGVQAQRIGLVDFDDYTHHVQLEDRKLVFHLLAVDHHNVKTKGDQWYYWYTANRVQQTQGGYSGRLLNGQFQSFYRSGQLLEQGKFDQGSKHGVWSNWLETGQLSMSAHYQKGILNGRFKKYDSLGVTIETGRFRDGKLEGQLKRIAKDGHWTLETYQKGILQPQNVQPSWLMRLYQKRKEKRASAKTISKKENKTNSVTVPKV